MRFQLIERWRSRLLTDESALPELLRAYPHADSAMLRTLVSNARKERDRAQPPKSYRALFQTLSEIVGDGDEKGERREA